MPQEATDRGFLSQRLKDTMRPRTQKGSTELAACAGPVPLAGNTKLYLDFLISPEASVAQLLKREAGWSHFWSVLNGRAAIPVDVNI